MIGLCRAEGIPVFEKNFSLVETYGAEEAFLTGTFGGQTPVAEIDGRRYGDGTRRSGDPAHPGALRASSSSVAEGRRIAMWSGPRNLSTAMMRSFGNRADCAAVMDEPFYAAYLAASGKEHPMRAEVLASQPQDWRAVARACATARSPPGRILYQKQMTHHMLPEFGLDWMDVVDHAFLIRAPERVVASYAARREEVALEDLGFDRQAELFDRVAQRARRGAAGGRRRGGPRRSGGGAAPALRRARAGVRPRHAGLAGRSAGERRGLGGALVCGGDRLDRVRGAGAGAAAAGRADARHRRGGAAGLRAAAGPRALKRGTGRCKVLELRR